MSGHIFLNLLVFCYSCSWYSNWRLHWNKLSSKLFPCWFICCFPRLLPTESSRLLQPWLGWSVPGTCPEQGLSALWWTPTTPRSRHPIASVGYWAGQQEQWGSRAGLLPWSLKKARGTASGDKALGQDLQQAWHSWAPGDPSPGAGGLSRCGRRARLPTTNHHWFEVWLCCRLSSHQRAGGHAGRRGCPQWGHPVLATSSGRAPAEGPLNPRHQSTELPLSGSTGRARESPPAAREASAEIATLGRLLVRPCCKGGPAAVSQR